MATTAIKIGDVRMKFMTMPKDLPAADGSGNIKTFTHIDLFSCDEDFIPQGNPNLSISEMTEEVYHKELRKLAKEKGHYVSEESTDPEWNPDYKPEQSEENGSESTL